MTIATTFLNDRELRELNDKLGYTQVASKHAAEMEMLPAGSSLHKTLKARLGMLNIAMQRAGDLYSAELLSLMQSGEPTESAEEAAFKTAKSLYKSQVAVIDRKYPVPDSDFKTNIDKFKKSSKKADP
ncbi:MAG: hypothetical protein WC829_16840 [Hyphomicrobium sp.]